MLTQQLVCFWLSHCPSPAPADSLSHINKILKKKKRKEKLLLYLYGHFHPQAIDLFMVINSQVEVAIN